MGSLWRTCDHEADSEGSSSVDNVLFYINYLHKFQITLYLLLNMLPVLKPKKLHVAKTSIFSFYSFLFFVGKQSYSLYCTHRES